MKRHEDLRGLLKWRDSYDEMGGRWIGLKLPGPDGETIPLVVIASWGLGWDHVSVSTRPVLQAPLSARRPPDWNTMEAARRVFFWNKDVVVQISPPLEKYVNFHPGVLHLWRNQTVEYPVPERGLIA